MLPVKISVKRCLLCTCTWAAPKMSSPKSGSKVFLMDGIHSMGAVDLGPVMGSQQVIECFPICLVNS